MNERVSNDNPQGVEYPCAVTKDGTLVYAIDIDNNEEEWKETTFYFLGCEGDENEIMIFSSRRHSKGVTKFFKHRQRYFPDPKEKDRYLHNYAEIALKERFDKSNEFIIKYFVEEKCSQHLFCDIKSLSKCQGKGRLSVRQLDLKKHYDTCTLEKGIGEDRKYIADLLLESSKDSSVKPLLIEVFVTHKCTYEKQNSGYPIIEIKVKDEKDIYADIEENTGELIDKYSEIKKSMNKSLPSVNIFGFKRNSEYTELVPYQEFRFGEFKGVYYGRINKILCKDVPNTSRNNLLMDLAVPEYLIKKKKLDLYEIGFAIANSYIENVKNCVLCKHYKGYYPCRWNYSLPINQLPHYCKDFDKSLKASSQCNFKYIPDDRRQKSLCSKLEKSEMRLWLDAGIQKPQPEPIKEKSDIIEGKNVRLLPPQECLECFMYRPNCGHYKGEKTEDSVRYVICDFNPHL